MPLAASLSDVHSHHSTPALGGAGFAEMRASRHEVPTPAPGEASCTDTAALLQNASMFQMALAVEPPSATPSDRSTATTPARRGMDMSCTPASLERPPTVALRHLFDDSQMMLPSPAAESPLKPKKPVPRVKPAVSRPVNTRESLTDFAAALPALLESGEYFLRLTDDGAGGTYFVVPRADPATPAAVFKPGEEEVGAPENPRGNDDVEDDERFAAGGFAPGDGYIREILAFDLDHHGAAGVPATVEAELNGRVASLQAFCPRMMQTWSTTPAKFDATSVLSIAVFDVRVLNCDRHGGNLLVPKEQPELAMVPIDHGLVLPETVCDPDFEWALWPQARLPVPEHLRAYVESLDADADAALVEERLGAGAGEIIAVTTRLLKAALARGKEYTLRDVADFCRRQSLTEPSGLERLFMRCRRDLDEGGDLDFAAVEAELARQFP